MSGMKEFVEKLKFIRSTGLEKSYKEVIEPGDFVKIEVGTELIYNGAKCTVVKIKQAEDGFYYANLEFEVVLGEKTGTDGWYVMERVRKYCQPVDSV